MLALFGFANVLIHVKRDLLGFYVIDSFSVATNSACDNKSLDLNTYTVFRKKTPTCVFFYISVENVSICTKFSGYVCEEL